MQDVADFQIVGVTDFADAAQDVREACAWHNSILYIELRANASHCPKGVLATCPKGRDTESSTVAIIPREESLVKDDC
jgi:hypothetical protein